MTLSPGDLVGGKYRVVRLIGTGGMGSVYEARHELLGAPVALKFLHAELAQRPGLAARFLQEARVSATIQSPHVARVTDVDTTQDGSPYLVMELLTGESLQALLDRRGKLEDDRAVDFTLQILAGLEAAHELGVVHRDLKPDNVFVTTTSGGPLLKLIDFGIAKLREASEYKKNLTRAGVVMGTAEYMAPEQLYAASEVDHRADLYSLGVMLFEMLSGARPADGDSAEAIIAKVLSGNVRTLSELAPNLRPGLSAIAERALASDRDRRFPSAFDMRLALSEYAGELSQAGRLAIASKKGSTSARINQGSPETPDALFSDTAFGSPPSAAAVPDTLDSPRVPATLPPEGAAAASAGSTQAAPPPLAAGVLSAAHSGARGRRKRGGRPWLIALGSLLALAAVGIVVAQVADRQRRPRLERLPPTAETRTEEQGIEPIVIPTPTEIPVLPATRTPNRSVPTAVRTPTADGGSPSIPLPFPSFALPSSLPPLPSTFPTSLPTAFPSFFPDFPGLSPPTTPPPISSSAPSP